MNLLIRKTVLLLFATFVIINTAQGKEKITISSHYLPPWVKKDCSGAATEITLRAFEIAGIPVQCIVTFRKRHLHTFLNKTVDFAVPFVEDIVADKNVYFTEKFLPLIDVATSYNPGLINLETLRKSRVVAYHSAKEILGQDYKQMTREHLHYHELVKREAQIHMLAGGRVDYIIGDRYISRFISRKLYPEKKLYTNMVVKEWNLGAAGHDKNVVTKFDYALKELKKSGEMNKIFEKYDILTEYPIYIETENEAE